MSISTILENASSFTFQDFKSFVLGLASQDVIMYHRYKETTIPTWTDRHTATLAFFFERDVSELCEEDIVVASKIYKKGIEAFWPIFFGE